jgi:CRP-like cAMP-binding protein
MPPPSRTKPPRSEPATNSEKNPKGAERNREFLRTGHWFAGLPETFQEALLHPARVKTLRKDELLFREGDPPDGIYGLVEGSIRGGSATTLFTLVVPPMWFGELSTFDHRGRTHDAFADLDTTLVHVPQAALKALLDKEPRLWEHLGRLLAAKLRLSFLWMGDGVTLPTSVRLARRLLLMAEGYGEWTRQTRRVLSVRQEQLAEMLATSRQSINQELRKLEAGGSIAVRYGSVEILDVKRLAAEAMRP